MSNEIKAGDLVVVIRGTPCCHYPFKIGLVFQVQRIGVFTPNDDSWRCDYCKRAFPKGIPIPTAAAPNGAVFEQRQLKRIDPPALDSTIPAEKELSL